jgi:hypothetical protein
MLKAVVFAMLQIMIFFPPKAYCAEETMMTVYLLVKHKLAPICIGKTTDNHTRLWNSNLGTLRELNCFTIDC